MTARLVIVAVLAVAVVFATWLYRRWRAGLQSHDAGHPIVPPSLREGAERTWVLFTTPYCATCEPVEASLRAWDPDARLVKVDASRQVALAEAFSVRAAPTALLADESGRVTARLVGADAVSRYVRKPT